MQKAIFSIVYYSREGHTEQIAKLVADNLRSTESEVFLIRTKEAKERLDILHASDAIIFGSPTYFSNVSSRFRQFMELTGTFWYKQVWKDKLAAGFTVS
jgi:NAD(P)H dehydrogenase (quinone)